MIRMQDIHRIYRTSAVETTALDTVNLHIAAGEFVAIMGPSGCGKSTLMNIMGLLDAPTSGSYVFNGTEVAGLAERALATLRKQHIGFIFQSFNLIDDLSVAENVELPLLYQGMAARQRRERVATVLERVAISHRSGHRPQQLSGGQQQRVAVARALVSEPALILADEPTGNLDSRNGEEVMGLLGELNAAGTTVVMVTHDQMHADHAGRTVHLLDGRVLAEDVAAVA